MKQEHCSKYGYSWGAHTQGAHMHLNQDRVRISDAGFVVVDGMGGMDAGEVYAEICAWSLERALLSRDFKPRSAAIEAVGAMRAFSAGTKTIGGACAAVGVFAHDCITIYTWGDVGVFQAKREALIPLSRCMYGPTGNVLGALTCDATPDCCQPKTVALSAPVEQETIIVVTDGVWRFLLERDYTDAVGKSRGNAMLAHIIVDQAALRASNDDRSALVITSGSEREDAQL